jgi:fucose permease
MPTLFEGYRGQGEWIALYSISIFFLLRAGGRFLGAWMLTKLAWGSALTIYPTVNSKGISCMPKAEHGDAAGVILFYTCLSAVLAPLAVGAISDAMGGPIYGFMLATGFAALLFVNAAEPALRPPSAVLGRADETEYQQLTSDISST